LKPENRLQKYELFLNWQNKVIKQQHDNRKVFSISLQYKFPDDGTIVGNDANNTADRFSLLTFHFFRIFALKKTQ